MHFFLGMFHFSVLAISLFEMLVAGFLKLFQAFSGLRTKKACRVPETVEEQISHWLELWGGGYLSFFLHRNV